MVLKKNFYLGTYTGADYNFPLVLENDAESRITSMFELSGKTLS